MKNLLYKEIKIASSPLSFIFIAFGILSIVPGYPILLSAFFICFGIFHTFQSSRENNDVLYTLLLPVKKTDAVKARFTFTIFIQMCGLIISAIITLFRLICLNNSEVYKNNALMNANQVYLAWMLIVFAAFNLLFIANYYKTAYKLGIPFLVFGIATLIIITIAEALHFFPNLTWLNGIDTLANTGMWLIFLAAFVIYILITAIAIKLSMKRFDKVDM